MNGKQALVKVLVASGSVGLGLPMTEIRGEITFMSTGIVNVDPSVFEGGFTMDSLGIQLGSIGLGSTTIYLGDAISTNINASGLDAGISTSFFGSSTVVHQSVFDANSNIDPQSLFERLGSPQ